MTTPEAQPTAAPVRAYLAETTVAIPYICRPMIACTKLTYGGSI